MIGYFTPDQRLLRNRERGVYNGLYCSLCFSLRKRYSLKSVVLLQPDLLFYLISCNKAFNKMDLFLEKSNYQRRKCVMNPFIKVNVLKGEIFNFAPVSDISVFMFYVYYLNKVIDNKMRPFTKLGGVYLNKIFERNHFYLSQSGINVISEIDRIKESLMVLNNKTFPKLRGDFVSIDDYILPSLNATSKIILKRLDEEDQFKEKFEFLTIMGKIMYYLDAIEDYHRDRKNNNFNLLEIQKNIPTFVRIFLIKHKMLNLINILRHSVINNFSSNIYFIDSILSSLEYRITHTVKKLMKSLK